MFKWKKLGKIFNPLEIKNSDWSKEYTQSPSVVIFEDFIRVYFCCRPSPDNDGKYISYLSYIDLNKNNLFDIININKDKILELGELGTFDEFGTYPASFIKTEKDIRVYYAGYTRCESVPFNSAIGMALSFNGGITFNRISNGPILSYSIDEPFLLGSPKIRKFNNVWYLWYVCGKKWIEDNNKLLPMYKIRMAESVDGINWKKYGKDLIENKYEYESNAGADVIFLNNKYHMFFCYRDTFDYKEKQRSYRIGYAYSNDLKNWTRDDKQVGIDVSKSGWDSEMICYPHVFELNGKIYMIYLGNNFGKYGFGLAELEGTL